MLPYHTPDITECGVDEAGRGALAGPVVAAAVVWPANVTHPDIKDSKKLSPARRAVMADFIKRHATRYAVAFVDHVDIDAINILQATYKAMHAAIAQVGPIDHIIVDGNRFKPFDNATRHTCVVAGDNTYLSIAAASILAKVTRDEYMSSVLHTAHPQYDFAKHKGYGTAAHMAAIATHGPSPVHRHTFLRSSSKKNTTTQQ